MRRYIEKGGVLLFLSSIILCQNDSELLRTLKRSLQNIAELPYTTYIPGHIYKPGKEKIRKDIIKKLQYLPPKPRIIYIEDEFRKKYYLLKGKANKTQQNIILQSYLVNTFNRYPSILPFTLPDFKKYIKDAGDSINFQTGENELHHYMELSRDIAGILVKKYLTFWLFLKTFFTSSDERFKYLYEKLCHREIYIKGDIEKNAPPLFPTTLTDKNIQDIINLNRKTPALDVLNFFKDTSNKKLYYLSKKIEVKKYTNDFFKKSFREDGKTSICYNLVILQLYSKTILNFSQRFSYIYKCLYNYFNGSKKYKKRCKRLPEYLVELYKGLRIYFYYQNRIIRKKVLPAIFDICYQKCLCKDYSISCAKKKKSDIIDENNIIEVLSKVFKNEKEIFLMKLSNFIEGINAINYPQEVEKKCASTQKLKQLLKTINSASKFLSSYTEVYKEWIDMRKNEKKRTFDRYLALLNKIEKLEIDFNKHQLQKKFVEIFNMEEDIICRFIIFTEIFSKIGYDNVLNIDYYYLIRLITSKNDKERFTGLVIYKIVSLQNTISYDNREIKFFNFGFDFPAKFSNITTSFLTLYEWLYGSKSTSVYNYYAGFMTFFDYYLFFMRQENSLIKYTGATSKLQQFGCFLNKNDFLGCILTALEPSQKPYFKILKKFFSQRKVYRINVRNLNSTLHRLNPHRNQNKLYQATDEIRECCEKTLNDKKNICGEDNSICSAKYQSMTYIRKKGEDRLKNILGENLFYFLQQQIKKYR